MDHTPTRVPPETHLTQDQLNEYWWNDLARNGFHQMAMRNRANGVMMPKSRHDLVSYYTQMDLEKSNGESV